MPLKLLSPGGGSVLLQANTTSLDYTLTVPAETANLITTATTSGINASAMSVGTIPTARLPTIPVANMPTGSILQVLQAYKDDPFAHNSTSYAAVTGLSVNITPQFSTSKILIMACINANSLNRGGLLEVRRNGNRFMMPSNYSNRGPTNIGSPWTGDGSGDGGMLFSPSNMLLDSPATTSTITYAVYVRVNDTSSYGTRINYTADDVDGSDYVRGTSSLTVMEIAG